MEFDEIGGKRGTHFKSNVLESVVNHDLVTNNTVVSIISPSPFLERKLGKLTWEAWLVDVAASSLAPSRLADSRDSCCLWARFPGCGGDGGDGRPACRCSERATIAPGIPSALVDLPTIRGEFELWARLVSSWLSTWWSPTMAAVVYGNERSWRTCGTSIPRRWAEDRSGKISFILFFIYLQFFFFNERGERGFLFSIFGFVFDREGVIIIIIISR